MNAGGKEQRKFSSVVGSPFCSRPTHTIFVLFLFEERRVATVKALSPWGARLCYAVARCEPVCMFHQQHALLPFSLLVQHKSRGYLILTPIRHNNARMFFFFWFSRRLVSSFLFQW